VYDEDDGLQSDFLGRVTIPGTELLRMALAHTDWAKASGLAPRFSGNAMLTTTGIEHYTGGSASTLQCSVLTVQYYLNFLCDLDTTLL
jgi:hypothetical protein